MQDSSQQSLCSYITILRATTFCVSCGMCICVLQLAEYSFPFSEEAWNKAMSLVAAWGGDTPVYLQIQWLTWISSLSVETPQPLFEGKTKTHQNALSFQRYYWKIQGKEPEVILSHWRPASWSKHRFCYWVNFFHGNRLLCFLSVVFSSDKSVV